MLNFESAKILMIDMTFITLNQCRPKDGLVLSSLVIY